MTFLSNSAAARLARGPLGRRVFSKMLWKAFPGDSELAVAERAAPVLGLSVRQVRRLLRGEHSARVEHVFAVSVVLGFETVLSMVFDQ